MSWPDVVVEADGGSRGNPGTAGYGAVVLDAATGRLLGERSGALGVATNNVAEYSGLIAGLQAALDLGARRVDVRMDSKLVIEQMCGRWQVKHPAMKPLAARAAALVRQFDAVRFSWIPRAKNTAADRLANLAMDGTPVNRDLVDASDDPAEPEPDLAETAQAAGPGRGAANPGSAAATQAGGPGWGAATQAGGPGWGAATSAPTSMVLVRHGASVLSPERRFSGRGDVPLSPDGAEQARRIAARLGTRDGVKAVISSPLRRARRTAEAIAAGLGLDVVIENDVIETNFGEWEGYTFAEVRERWPDLLTEWLASPDVAPPGGESFAGTAERVLRARDRLLSAYPAATIVVVSHVGPIKTLLRSALDAPPQTMFRMQIDVASVSEVDWYADGPATVRLLNDAHHLG